MNAASQTSFLKQLDAFKDCSPKILAKLCDQIDLVTFNPGQIISALNIIPNRVLVLTEGKARLLGSNNGKLSTFELFSTGSFIGLASLLRAEACEEVSAASIVKAYSIPDTLIAEIYTHDSSFRKWCNTTVFPAEISILLGSLLEVSANNSANILAFLAKAIATAKVFTSSSETELKQELSTTNNIFIASGNTSLPLNQLITSVDELEPSSGCFDLRLLCMPDIYIEKGKSDDIKSIEPVLYSENESEHTSTKILARTSLSLNNQNQSNKITIVKGSGPLEEIMACLKMLSQAMGLPFRRDSIEKSIRDSLRRGKQPSLPVLGQLAVSMGLHAVGAQVNKKACTSLNTPCITTWDSSFCVVTESNASGLVIAHPRLGWLQVTPEEFAADGQNQFDVIYVDRTHASPDAKFNLTWFVPIIKRYRTTLSQVLLASFVVQLFTLANPLLIQVIIDKVITQRSLDTLQVLGIALVGVTLFEGILGSLRTFLFTDTTNRIDMRLGSEVIDHLLRLPVGYFDKRPVGELGTRVAELEKIRNFLTGEALTTIIDAAFSIIYIMVMALYSWLLTIIALIVVPIQIGITLIGAPLFRRQFRQAAEENARTQSHLIEVLTGIQTVKAQNVEMVSRWKWQERYGKYIARTFEKTITGTAVTQTSQVLQKLSQLMVLWIGASQVLAGNLSLGQLIAFRIISGYVTQPLLRLSTIWQRIQELRVSFERLADIVDTPTESTEIDKGKIPLPPLTGNIKIEKLQFSFSVNSPQILKNIDLNIPSGTFVGVVGQSGSGKSTLMKLLPRLYSPNSGRILIDNYDIDKVELYSLRRQIGIVPQEPLLFTGSVSENIALTDPDATSEEISRAARIACAHEFIMELPSGYSTKLVERGSNISGGQRQRLAISRTLLSNPKLLIMDEATSALDYDTERRVCQNLREELKGCTVFFVTHRLSTISNADLIVMLHQGAIVEKGTHDELMSLKGRYYALFRQQEAA